MRSIRPFHLACLALSLGCSVPGSVPAPESVPRQAVDADLPRTVAQAVDRILDRMPEEEQKRLRVSRRADLIDHLHSWGRNIRNEFCLWGGNDPLLKDCGTDSPEGASRVIMEATWDRVQKR